ncbi:MAG: hypothetical protein Q4A06_08945 [Cardiobacteriaceae bacterium]|nr:hypothetical protein [Cardiobacteriaceae bacterium]
MKKTAMLALAGLLASGATFAETAPAKQEKAETKATQGACGEGKCAANNARKEGEELKICGEGQTAEKDNCKVAEGACGGKSSEGACGADGKAADGKTAEGACGGKNSEGSCGADKKARK